MKTELVFPGYVPGNNGTKGLLRMKHKDKTRLRNGYQYQARTCTTNRHPGKVRVELIRHGWGQPMDYDNLVSTGKLLLDAIKRAGIIVDDKMAIIVQRSYEQTPALNPNSQFTVIRITDYEETAATTNQPDSSPTL